MVLLWLSQLVLLPFKLALLDSSLADTDQDQRWGPHIGAMATVIRPITRPSLSPLLNATSQLS